MEDWGERIPVPRIYDPDSYDPEGPLPWTPEPEPYDPETYAAWGRKRFGEEWYKRRCTMLHERNIYLDPPDPVYRERQIAIRRLETRVEGRPIFDKGTNSEEWKRLWARLSKDLGLQPESPLPPTNPDGSIPSGYSTYDPTPNQSREPTPFPADDLERLESERKLFGYNEEYYQFRKIGIKESHINAKRRRYEDEPGDRQRKEELDAIERIRYAPAGSPG